MEGLVPSNISYQHFPMHQVIDWIVIVFMKVRFQASQIQMLPSNSRLFSWETYDEDITSLEESSRITASGLIDQINATRDTSDYLWYITR